VHRAAGPEPLNDLAGEPADDLPLARGVVQPVPDGDEAGGGRAAEEALPFDDGRAGAQPCGGHGGEHARRAATHHQHVHLIGHGHVPRRLMHRSAHGFLLTWAALPVLRPVRLRQGGAGSKRAAQLPVEG